jgi:hypothetical protein
MPGVPVRAELQRRAEHFYGVVKAGLSPIWVAVTAALTLVGGSALLSLLWGVRHLLWGLVILLAILVFAVIEGSYRESRHRDENHASQVARLEQDRDAIRTELEDARRAAVAIGGHGAEAPSKHGLEVAIDNEVPTARPGVGLILEIEFHVTNHDPMEHQLFRAMEGGPDGMFYFEPPNAEADPEHQRFIRDSYVIEERRDRDTPVPTRVRPGETVRGVYVQRFAWNPRRTLPDYTLVISDGRREFRVQPHGAAENTPTRAESSTEG